RLEPVSACQKWFAAVQRYEKLFDSLPLRKIHRLWRKGFDDFQRHDLWLCLVGKISQIEHIAVWAIQVAKLGHLQKVERNMGRHTSLIAWCFVAPSLGDRVWRQGLPKKSKHGLHNTSVLKI